ncbi:MAG: nucleotidyltransferase domain-containing protein [Planctomycetia bacterium]|nr:nucleotidyltransferase domain-containing protein [Planctomycetia bacterium]
MDILRLAEERQRAAREVLRRCGAVDAWESAGAEVRLVGSLRTGLLLNHRDIDLHVYTDPLSVSTGFRAIGKMAEDPRLERVTYSNLSQTPEHCIEWHAWFRDDDTQSWQLDMIHILKGSTYDGYFERIADRILTVLTPETKRTILTLRYETPESEKIMGIEYCQAVLRDGVQTWTEFTQWRSGHRPSGIIDWIP